MNVARRLKAEIREDRTHGLGRRRAQQVPGEDRLRLAEARRPDGHRSRARRAVPAGAAGRRAVGRRTGDARKLRARGIDKLIDVRAADPTVLRDAVGSLADWLQQLARGHDDRPVVAEHEPKSSGSENTFERDLTDLADDPGRDRGMAGARGRLAGASASSSRAP